MRFGSTAVIVFALFGVTPANAISFGVSAEVRFDDFVVVDKTHRTLSSSFTYPGLSIDLRTAPPGEFWVIEDVIFNVNRGGPLRITLNSATASSQVHINTILNPGRYSLFDLTNTPHDLAFYAPTGGISIVTSPMASLA